LDTPPGGRVLVGIIRGYFSLERLDYLKKQPNEEAAELAEKRPVFMLLSE
jgi:hypothetical protein